MTIEKEKLDESLEELKAFLSEPRGVPELESELEARLEQITSYKTRLTDLKIRQQSLQSAIAVAERNPGNTNKIVLQNSKRYPRKWTTNGRRCCTLLKIEQAEVEADLVNIDKQINILQEEIEELQVELQEKDIRKILNHRVQQKIHMMPCMRELR